MKFALNSSSLISLLVDVGGSDMVRRPLGNDEVNLWFKSSSLGMKLFCTRIHYLIHHSIFHLEVGHDLELKGSFKMYAHKPFIPNPELLLNSLMLVPPTSLISDLIPTGMKHFAFIEPIKYVTRIKECRHIKRNTVCSECANFAHL